MDRWRSFRMATAAAAMACACVAAVAQRRAAPAAPRFEVASIRVTAQHAPRMRGMDTGMGCARDPVRITCSDMPLAYYVRLAYGLAPYQLRAPGWMNADRFDLQATFPAGTTSDQLRHMEQTLLAERFGLIVRREVALAAAHELSVGPAGARLLHPTAAEAAIPEPARKLLTPLGLNGCPKVSPAAFQHGILSTVVIHGTGVCLLGSGVTLDALAAQLERYLNGPVVNRTGLGGRYDIALGFMPRGMAATAQPGQTVALPLAEALRLQLGLRLEEIKTKQDSVVVIRCNQSPTGN